MDKELTKNGYIEKIPMRDVEVRELVREKFNLCKKCVDRFTKEELILVFNHRFKD